MVVAPVWDLLAGGCCASFVLPQRRCGMGRPLCEVDDHQGDIDFNEMHNLKQDIDREMLNLYQFFNIIIKETQND